MGSVNPSATGPEDRRVRRTGAREGRRFENAAVLGSWSSVIDYCRASMAFSQVEQFRILFLDKREQC